MDMVMLFYVVLYMILGLVIYHSIFEIWYLNLGKALMGELFGAFLFAMLMTWLTLKYWGAALVIIVLIGLAMSAKVQDPTGKKIVMGVFVAVAIITAITGIKSNRQDKEKKAEIERLEQEAEKEHALYHTPIDPGIHLVESDNTNDLFAGTTYVSRSDGSYKFANVEYEDDSYGKIRVKFIIEKNGSFFSEGYYYGFQNNADQPLLYKWDDEDTLEIKNEDEFIIRGDSISDYEGNYTLSKETDIEYYNTVMNSAYYSPADSELDNHGEDYNQEEEYESDSEDLSYAGTYEKGNENELFFTDDALQEEYYGETIVIEGFDGGVILREGPGVEYSVTYERKIPNGYHLLGERIQYSSDGEPWVYTQFNGYTGYVNMSETMSENLYNEYVIPDSDRAFILGSSLDKFDKSQLRLARNEILARHGRIFKSEDLQDYFGGKSWYEAKYTSEEFDEQMDAILNKYEKQNIEMIKARE